MMIAHDAERLREMAEHHRRCMDYGSIVQSFQHEEWSETLEEVAALLDRLVALIGDDIEIIKQ